MRPRSFAAVAALVVTAAVITAGTVTSTKPGSESRAGAAASTATPSFGVGRLDFRVDGLQFKWAALPGANSYRLKGQVVGFTGVPGEDRCQTLSRGNNSTAAFDVTLSAATTSYTFAQPAAGETFLVNSIDVRLDALSPSGQVIESSPIRIAGPESGCETPAAADTPSAAMAVPSASTDATAVAGSATAAVVPPDTGSAGLAATRTRGGNSD